MQQSKGYGKIALNLAIAFLILLAFLFVIPRILIFFMPFVIGWIISLLANPLVKYLEEKLRIKRKAVSVLVIVLVLIVIGGVGYLAVSKLLLELAGFISSLPELWNSMQADFEEIGRNMDVFLKKLPVEIQNSILAIENQMDSAIAGIMKNVSAPTFIAVGSFAKNIPSGIIAVIMTALSSYFFTTEKNYVSEKAKHYMPLSLQKKWNIMFGSLKRAVGGYFKAQLKIEVWMYLLLAIGLMILHVDYAFLIALGMALLDFFPFFGTGIVLIPWAVVKILSADYMMALGLLIMWGVGQLVRQIIQPKIVGDSIGMPPIPTLFLLFIGYKVASVFGMIMAVPIGIIIVNLYEAGAFDTTKTSLRLLIKRVNDYRRYTKEEISYLEEELQEAAAEDMIESQEQQTDVFGK
ncbi:MAG: sporulation integral membrane protein YtvI [Lachnospiraceae bacterium]